MADGARVLVVDNHDSFVHTLVGYLHELGARCTVIEADAIESPDAEIAGFDGILISPGPGAPRDAGASAAIVHAAARARVPLLGVCLGHQVLAEAYGATVSQAPELLHGITSPVHHDGTGLFTGMPQPFEATRYHSLAVERASLPRELAVTAQTDSGVIMAMAHESLPLQGVQFHPESVLTESGYRLLGNWLAGLGMPEAPSRGALLAPHRTVG